jgi:hypothetical protein
VPISRLEPQQGGMIGIGRTSEVTRDEVKFDKFIQRLRNKFSKIFDNALRIQLTLKGVCTSEEWEEFKEDIYFDYKKDNNFTELSEAELLKERMSVLGIVDPYVGKYFSMEWVRKYVLRLSDETIAEIDKQMKKEESLGIGGPTVPPDQQPQPDEDQYPPEDNTQDADAEESPTPMLDNAVEKQSSTLNKK